VASLLVPRRPGPPPARPPGRAPPNAVVQAPRARTRVLVANPMDKSVYYYKEGMAAPMGNFSNYGRQPRALLVRRPHP